eukprot:gene31885-42528_t
MQGTGKTYAISGETTEWEDILIKKGITTKEDVLLSKGLNPEDFLERPKDIEIVEESLIDKLQYATKEEIDELEEDEFDDNRALNEYREKRLRELKESQVKNRFGDVLGIGKDDWIREVTDCSKTCWVVVHLYQDSVVECQLVDEAFIILSTKFKYVKFVKIRSTQAIENWPDRNLPTIFAYHEGVLQKQLVTLKQIGGKTMKASDLEWWLAENDIVNSELEENPRSNNISTNKFTLNSQASRYCALQ